MLPSGFESKTVIEVDYFVFEAFAGDVLGAKNCRIELFGIDNDRDYTFVVKKKEPLDGDDLSKLNQIINYGSCDISSCRLLLQEIVNKDRLPVGEYVICVSW